MKNFPFLKLSRCLSLLRVSVAILFMAHAAVRVANGSIVQFAGFMEAKGFIFATALVWAITIFELIGGALMIAGRWTKSLAAGFMLIAGAGIIVIHAQNGWFVGEHGTGGMEYSVLLLIALLVIASGSSDASKPLSAR